MNTCKLQISHTHGWRWLRARIIAGTHTHTHTSEIYMFTCWSCINNKTDELLGYAGPDAEAHVLKSVQCYVGKYMLTRKKT
jgi:hypothetical protein